MNPSYPTETARKLRKVRRKKMKWMPDWYNDVVFKRQFRAILKAEMVRIMWGDK